MRTRRPHDRPANALKHASRVCGARRIDELKERDVVHELEGAVPRSRDETNPLREAFPKRRCGTIESPTCSPNANHEHNDNLSLDTPPTTGLQPLLYPSQQGWSAWNRTFCVTIKRE
jgi:hypothetical protein